MFLSDALSRISVSQSSTESNEVSEIMYEIEQVKQTENVDISDSLLEEIKRATNEDKVLQEIKGYVLTVWPTNIRKIKNYNARKFFAIRNDIIYAEGLLIKGREQIIIPEQMRKEMSVRLHRSHLGTSYTLQFARRTVFWPGFSEDIKRVCSECTTCQKFSAEVLKMPMQSTRIASYAGEIVSMDIFDLVVNGQRNQYLVIVDHYSDYFEIKKLRDLQSITVSSVLKEYFSRLGVPRRVICDNAKQFLSKMLQEFSIKWSFKICNSDPYHSQGNGKAESSVKSEKQLLKKAEDCDEDYQLLLLQHRNTPNNTGFSPNERLFGRATNIPNIPQLKSSFIPNNSSTVKKKLIENRQRAKAWYDKKTRTLPNLSIGQPVFVRVKPEHERVPGTILKQVKDRSYIIQTRSGNYRRNRTDIINRSSPPDVSNSSVDSSPLEYFSPPIIPTQSSPYNSDQINTTNSFADNSTPRISRYGRILRKPLRLRDYL